MSSAASLLLLTALGLVCRCGAMLTVSVKEGEEAVLPCIFGNLNNKKVVWTDQNKEVLTYQGRRIKNDPRLSAGSNGTSWNLHILDVTADDQGLYTCRINTNPVRMKSVLLSLAGEETPQKFDIQAMNVTTDEGQKVTLPCSFPQVANASMVKVTWTDPKSMLLTIEERILTADNRFSVAFTPPATWDLTLTSPVPSDNGVYTCRVNSATPSMRTVTLTVNAAAPTTKPGEEGEQGNGGDAGGKEGGSAMDKSGVQEVRAEVGRVAFLPCTHSASHTNLVVWKRSGTMLTIGRRRVTRDRRLHVRRPDSSTWTLRLRPVKSSDAGLYECVDNEAKQTKTLRLVVIDPPRFLQKNFERKRTVVEGSDVTLNCSASGMPEPRVTWYKSMEPGSMEELPDRDGVLTLYDVTRNMSNVTVTCKVDNGVRKPLTRRASIHVLYPPVVTVPVGPVQMKIGSRLSLICNVTAPHGTEVTWERLSASEVGEADRVDLDRLRAEFGFTVFEFVPGQEQLRLVLEKDALEEEDFTVYRCSASNAQGQTHGHVQIKELKVFPVTNMTASKGEQVVLPCGTDDLSNDMQVTWMRDQEVLAQNERVLAFEPRYSVSTPSPGQWNLVISDVMPSDRGDYQCLVDTGAKEQYTISLDVDVPTRLTSPPIDVTVVQGEDVTLQCEAEGEPEPEVTWYRYTWEGRVPADEVVRTAGEFVLSGAEIDDSGVYECVANNNVHPTAAGNASLTVMFTPEVNILESDMMARRGQEVEMSCVVAAMPRVTGVWIKDGVQLEARRRQVELFSQQLNDFTTKVTLKIVPTGDRDFGPYRCMAANAMGQGQDRMLLGEDVDSDSDKKPRRKKKKKNRMGNEEEGVSSPEPEQTDVGAATTPYIPPSEGTNQGVPVESVSGKDAGAAFTVSIATLLAALTASLTGAVPAIPSLT